MAYDLDDKPVCEEETIVICEELVTKYLFDQAVKKSGKVVWMEADKSIDQDQMTAQIETALGNKST